MRDTIKRLIEKSYSNGVAQAYLSFSPSKHDIERLRQVAVEVLTHIRLDPGACAMMSAVWATKLIHTGKYPVHVVAGDLIIKGQSIFSCGNDQSGTAFKTDNLDWTGHCWIVFGDHIGDISICRTAYSDRVPGLKEFIVENIGEKAGALICTQYEFAEIGMQYTPRYVLDQAAIDGMYNWCLYWTQASR